MQCTTIHGDDLCLRPALPLGDAVLLGQVLTDFRQQLQTVLGLLETGRKLYVVRDALGSRHLESKERRSVVWNATGRKSSPPRWSSSNG
jgi:hypothetical protein